MPSSTAEIILLASQQYTLLVCFIILFSGIFGHIANIFVLTRLKIFRDNPSAFYLIAESIVNLFQMFVPFTSLIAMNGFDYDLTQTSLLWCKFRHVLTQASTLISFSIVCFAAIDQYLSTNLRPHLRQISTISLAKSLIAIASIVWILHELPAGIFFEIRSTSGCNIYNKQFVIYITYIYYLILTGALPIIISTLFSILAYRNVRRIIRRQIAVRRRKLDQQLTAMIIVRTGFFVVMILPYTSQRIYNYSIAINKNDLVYKAIVQLSGAVAISLFYLNYSSSWYIFLISSARYRRQVRYVFVNKFWRMYCQKRARNNQVFPMYQFHPSDDDSQSI